MKEYQFKQFTGGFAAKDDAQALATMQALETLIKVITPTDIIKLGKMVKEKPSGWNMYKKMLGF
jgi:hypothetical protein